MHLSSSFAVILCTVLFSQYINCSPKTDEPWWNNITGQETRQKKTWTTLDSKPTPKPTTQSSRFLKRSSAAFDDELTDSPLRSRSRNWEKSYARRRNFDRTWKDDTPVRDRFEETEWDDEVPVRHVFRDSTSSIDEGPSRNRFGDELQRDKMSRPWSRGDSWGDSFSSGRTNNNNNNRNNNINSSIKPKTTTTTSKQPKSDRSDRILNLNFQDPDSKKKDKERLNKLAEQIFGSMEGVNTGDGNGVTTGNGGASTGSSRNSNGNTFNSGSRYNGNNGNTVSSGNRNNGNNGNTFSTIPRTNGNNGNTISSVSRSNGNNGNTFSTVPRSNSNNGNTFSSVTRNNGRTNANDNNFGNGYVSNAMNTFTRGSGNAFTSTGSDILRTNGNEKKSEKQTTNKFSATNALVKPKFNVVETTAAKPDRTSNTAKPNIANDVRGVAEKPKSSTTPSAPLKFGWRSVITHSNNQTNQKLQNSVNEDNSNGSEDEGEDDFGDEFEDDFDDTTTTSAPTRATTRTTTLRPTTRPAIRTTLRPTTMKAGVEYTTYRSPDTTRPQTTTSITNRPNALNTFTTSRPNPITAKTTTKGSTNNLAPDKKQHRMGSWVDSESLDYVENEADDFAEDGDQDLPQPLPQPQPLLGEEEYEDDEQLPERVEEAPIPPPQSQEQKFARQLTREDESEGEGGEGTRLEDALPGVPGTDYPTFAVIPRTAFDCKTHEWPGYYADIETQCQVFHICQTGGRKNSFLCPNGTMFNQQLFVCDWWHNVQCGDSPTHYPLNENIYDHNWESKRVSPIVEQEGSIKRSGAIEADPVAAPLIDVTTETPETEPEEDLPDSLERRSDSDNNPIDEPNDDFIDEEENEPRKAQLVKRGRSPVRIYRTSRIITEPDRQKRRRRKRGYLKN